MWTFVGIGTLQFDGVFCVVCLQMFLTIRVIGKCPWTVGTFIRSFARMLPYMHLQSRVLDERARAVRTLIGTLASMATHMHRQVIDCAEGLQTILTLVRSLVLYVFP